MGLVGLAGWTQRNVWKWVEHRSQVYVAGWTRHRLSAFPALLEIA